jgi:hypothetical protein
MGAAVRGRLRPQETVPSFAPVSPLARETARAVGRDEGREAKRVRSAASGDSGVKCPKRRPMRVVCAMTRGHHEQRSTSESFRKTSGTGFAHCANLEVRTGQTEPNVDAPRMHTRGARPCNAADSVLKPQRRSNHSPPMSSCSSCPTRGLGMSTVVIHTDSTARG